MHFYQVMKRLIPWLKTSWDRNILYLLSSHIQAFQAFHSEETEHI